MEVGHEVQKPGIGMCLAGGHLSNLGVLAFSAYMAIGAAASASAEAMFMGLGLPGRG